LKDFPGTLLCSWCRDCLCSYEALILRRHHYTSTRRSYFINDFPKNRLRIVVFRNIFYIRIFKLSILARRVLEPSQPPIQWMTGASSLGVERLGREADHSPPTSAEVEKTCICACTRPIRLYGISLN
jgi:hypothetical protein